MLQFINFLAKLTAPDTSGSNREVYMYPKAMKLGTNDTRDKANSNISGERSIVEQSDCTLYSTENNDWLK